MAWNSLVASAVVVMVLICQCAVKTDKPDWRDLESLTERYSYVVALLGSNKEYICTGTVINKQIVLTSGHCVIINPKYVAVGTALLNKYTSMNNLINVAYTQRHSDYNYILEDVYNSTQIHSNLALVVVEKPVLDLYVEVATLGNYYAIELKGKKMVAIGYSKVICESDIYVLRVEDYRQTQCPNPKWYYCVCGLALKKSTKDTKSNVIKFGEGGPVLFGSEVVGVTAAPCGRLRLQNDVHYNVFTVIAPYLPWITKSKTLEMRLRVQTNSGNIIKIPFMIMVIQVMPVR